ncbi:hypothetical protein ACJRO7_031774 [Eucalyptus globulus]|uniref:Uncharacterized protein n=1 Tax=Eucalyptus globulus TaxID=34317 RepID=A0ABD3JHS4_EUCGL
MEVKASRKMVLIVTSVLILSTFVAEIYVDAADCAKFCADVCSATEDPISCYDACFKRCAKSDGLVPPELGHCKLGCLASTCFDQRSDVKKVEAYEEKVEACADSCSESCQKSYVPH